MGADRFSLRDLSFGGWVSGVGHVVLITWLLSGWGLRNQPLEFQATPVTAISGAEYAELVAATTPDAQTDAADAPMAPPTDDAPPETTPPPDAPTPAPAPQVQPETPQDEAPPPQPPEPMPEQAEVLDAPPEMTVPEEYVPPAAPETAARPQPRAAPRVAAEAVAPPPPDADIAPQVQEEAAPEAESPEVVEEATREAAPEETATEIVTEADTPSGAPDVSLRPQTRPQRPAAQPEPEAPRQTAAAEPTQTPEPARQAEPDSSVDDALAAALAAEAAASAQAPAATANPGPPMTGAERDAFRLAVSGCWAVDPGSEAAMVTVTVRFGLDPQGRVIGNDVQQVNASGGSASAINSAFQFARRAVLRCQSNGGYQLPADKYEQWREVEMTFDPSGMRMR